MFAIPDQRRSWPRWMPVIGALLILCLPNLLALILQKDMAMKVRIVVFSFSLGILLVPWLLFPGRKLLWGSLPLAVMAPFEAFHIAVMGAPSTEGMIGSLLDTTPREALELGWHVYLMIVFALMIPAGQAMILWRSRNGKIAIGGRRMRLALFTAAFLGVTLEGLHIARLPVSSRWKIVAVKEHFKQTFPFGLLLKAGSVLRQKTILATRSFRVANYEWLPNRATPDSVAETYVIIVGEASRAGNWSLYGYDRPTSMLTESDSSLIAFENVTSGANLTFEAVSQLFTLATPQEPEMFESTSSILCAFRQSGFATWWLSLQSRFGLSDGKPTMIGLEADVSRFLTTDFTDGGSSLLDSSLLPLLDSALRSSATKKMIVLHTLGSHYRYDRRYPKEFERFLDSSGALLSDRDKYDNSIAYTDWFVMQVKRRLQQQPGVKALAYVSDHGEALGELGLSKHGNQSPARAEFEVPLVLWLSPELEIMRPDVSKALHSHIKASVNTSDFPATWLEIAGIQSPRTDSTRNLARETYRERRRWAVGASRALVDVDRLQGSSLSSRPPLQSLLADKSSIRGPRPQ